MAIVGGGIYIFTLPRFRNWNSDDQRGPKKEESLFKFVHTFAKLSVGTELIATFPHEEKNIQPGRVAKVGSIVNPYTVLLTFEPLTMYPNYEAFKKERCIKFCPFVLTSK